MQEPTPWPGYRGFVAGILFAIASVAIFLVDIPALRHWLPAVRLIVVALWALRAFRADD